jgi:hypothetical protein
MVDGAIAVDVLAALTRVREDLTRSLQSLQHLAEVLSTNGYETFTGETRRALAVVDRQIEEARSAARST